MRAARVRAAEPIVDAACDAGGDRFRLAISVGVDGRRPQARDAVGRNRLRLDTGRQARFQNDFACEVRFTALGDDDAECDGIDPVLINMVWPIPSPRPAWFASAEVWPSLTNAFPDFTKGVRAPATMATL